MSVEFEGDFRGPQYAQSQQLNTSPSSGMTGWLLKKGIIQEESQAKAVLLGIVVLNFILIGIIIFVFVL